MIVRAGGITTQTLYNVQQFETWTIQNRLLPSSIAICKLLFRISGHETRPLIRSCMPQIHNKTINTRSSNKYIEFTFKNDTFNKSFFPVGISKYANSLHTQLRVGQSYLNSHGFKINLREDDLCLCHRSETVSHFFLDCFLYQEERDELFKKISQYLPGFQTFSKTKKLEIILYGFNLSNIEPDPRNISIVFAVQKYIMKPNVFTLHPPPPLPPLQHTHLTPTHTPHLTLSHLLLCWLSLPTFFFLAAPGVELFPQAQHSDYTVFGFDVMTSFAT